MANISKSQDPCNLAGTYSFNGAYLTPSTELQRSLVLFKNPKTGLTQRPFKIRFTDAQKPFSGLRYVGSSCNVLVFDYLLSTGEKCNYKMTVSDCKTKAVIEYVQL